MRKFTQHARIRMGQRGIPDRLIKFAQKHGRVDGDRLVLDRKELRVLLDEIDADRQKVLKAMDKGGVVVVESGDTVVTAFNITERRYGH